MRPEVYSRASSEELKYLDELAGTSILKLTPHFQMNFQFGILTIVFFIRRIVSTGFPVTKGAG